MEMGALPQTQPSAPSALHATVASPLEALAAELGASMARMERTLRLEFDLGMAQIRAENERLGRLAAEMTTRALQAEQDMRETVRERLSGLPDVAALVSDEFDRREEAFAQRAAALVLPPDPGVIAEAVGTEVKLQIPTIAQRAAELAPEPDVAGAVSAEFDRREEDFIVRAAGMVAGPDDAEIASAIRGHVDTVLPVVVERAAAAVRLPEMPDVGSAVADELARRYDGIVDTAAALALTRMPDPPDINAAIDAALEQRLPEISRQAAELVPAPEVPDVAGAVSAELDQRENGIIVQAAARAAELIDPPAELPDIPAMVAEAVPTAVAAAVQHEFDLCKPELVLRVVSSIEVPELPDLAAALGEEFDRRQSEMVAAAAALVRVPELPDVEAIVAEKVFHAVGAAFVCLPIPENGKDADPEVTASLVRNLVTVAVEALPKGLSADEQRAVIEELINTSLARAVAELPLPEKGDSVTLEDVRPTIEAEISRQMALVETPAPDGEAIARAVDAAIELEMPEIVRQAAAQIPPLEMPDVAGALSEAVSDELDRREDEIADRVALATLKRLPEPPTLPDIPALVHESVADAVAQIPPAEPGDRGPPGLLPKVTEWVDRVYYDSEVVTHGGRLYQAMRDTGREPPHEDWLCIAFAEDARSLRIRETYSADVTDYRALDIVGLNGCSFVARRDNPGPCPGAGWQLLSDRGKVGPRIPGIKGDPGPPGPGLLALTIKDDAILTATNADGTTASVDLYPLLKKLER